MCGEERDLVQITSRKVELWICYARLLVIPLLFSALVPTLGLSRIGRILGPRMVPPRKKIIVMVIGNRSAGKSAFINWYMADNIQKTGVSLETQGITFLTSGRKRATFRGNTSVQVFPHFKPLLEIRAMSHYITAEISISKEKKFQLLTLIDTPGLVDGEGVYPFDLNEVLIWLGEQADLILIFFDPVGKANCKRLLDIVLKLKDTRGDNLHFYLSNANLLTNSNESKNVILNIIQEMNLYPGLGGYASNIQAFYIPNPKKSNRYVNQIDKLCATIDEKVDQTVENALKQLEKDCDQIIELITKQFKQSKQNSISNLKIHLKCYLLKIFGFLLPVLFVLSVLLNLLSRNFLLKIFNEKSLNVLLTFSSFLLATWDWIPIENQFYTLLMFLGMCYLSIRVPQRYMRLKPTLSKKSKRKMTLWLQFVKNVAKPKQIQLRKAYSALKASNSENK
uniref:Uncharacterized LOC103188467 n=1 Tax=Callorhinchus milii TaxID=7868 RepID=A0A4W3J9E5_CALMI|eukprot:gi/632979815/ref/XP_007906682.1/ PREDICTED: uncharacterized protein LOC103188467 [Callorhinchus milii]